MQLTIFRMQLSEIPRKCLTKTRVCSSILSNGTLVVRDVEGRRGSEANSEGSYQCLVSIESGERSLKFLSRKAALRVASLPRFVEQPRDREVLAGQAVLIPCRTDSKPPPSVRWYKVRPSHASLFRAHEPDDDEDDSRMGA